MLFDVNIFVAPTIDGRLKTAGVAGSALALSQVALIMIGGRRVRGPTTRSRGHDDPNEPISAVPPEPLPHRRCPTSRATCRTPTKTTNSSQPDLCYAATGKAMTRQLRSVTFGGDNGLTAEQRATRTRAVNGGLVTGFLARTLL